MLRRFLSIFKRDKTGFSSEELEWQKKWLRIIAYVFGFVVLYLQWFIIYLLACYTVIEENIEYAFALIMLFGIVVCFFLSMLIVGDLVYKLSMQHFFKDFSNNEKE